MLNQVRSLQNERVEVGHFEEQGEHYSGFTYAQLMAYHHDSSNLEGENPLPARPILDYVWASNINLSDPKFKQVLRKWGSRPITPQSNEEFLSDIGHILAVKEKEMFGKSPPLIANAESKGRNTPLVDTGDLRDKVSHRNTLSNTIKGVP